MLCWLQQQNLPHHQQQLLHLWSCVQGSSLLLEMLCRLRQQQLLLHLWSSVQASRLLLEMLSHLRQQQLQHHLLHRVSCVCCYNLLLQLSVAWLLQSAAAPCLCSLLLLLLLLLELRCQM
jgi:hypothetical protein